MEQIKEIYRYRESLLDKKCPSHLNTREIRNVWHESIKREYQLLTQKLLKLEAEKLAMLSKFNGDLVSDE